MSSLLTTLPDHLVFLFRDVKLVEPADDLDVGPEGLGDRLDERADDRVAGEEVRRQEQLGGVVDSLKQKGHRRAQGVALGHEQQPVEFFLLGAVELEVDHLLGVEPGEIDAGGLLQDLGLDVAGRVAEHAEPVVEVAGELHVAEGDEPVEPGVGDRFDRDVKTVAGDPLFEGFS